MTTDQTGTVLSWSDEAGFGFIEGDNGTVYFVHFSGIEADGYKTATSMPRSTCGSSRPIRSSRG